MKQTNLPVKLIAHRGANGLAPENTLAAFYPCLEYGLDYIEVDVRSSADGILYNFHDSSLNRTSSGIGPFNEKKSDELDKLEVSSWFARDFPSQSIPRISEMLSVAQGKINFYFDVKDANIRQLLDLVYQYKMEKKCFFWFKSLSAALEFRKLAPELALKVNCSNPDQIDQLIDQLNPRIIECDHYSYTDHLFKKCRQKNLKIMINLNGCTQASFQEVLKWNIDMIVLDQPVLKLMIYRQERKNCES